MEIKLYLDGASRNNPGHAGIGVAAFDGKKKVFEIGEYIGETTNNCAEYFALIRGLEETLFHGYKKASAYSDSELMVKQINGEYKIKNEQLKLLHNQAKKLISKLEKFNIKHIPREENKLADNLANRGIDSHN